MSELKAEETNDCHLCGTTIINALIKNIRCQDGRPEVLGVCENCCEQLKMIPYLTVVDGEIKR